MMDIQFEKVPNGLVGQLARHDYETLANLLRVKKPLPVALIRDLSTNPSMDHPPGTVLINSDLVMCPSGVWVAQFLQQYLRELAKHLIREEFGLTEVKNTLFFASLYVLLLQRAKPHFEQGFGLTAYAQGRGPVSLTWLDPISWLSCNDLIDCDEQQQCIAFPFIRAVLKRFEHSDRSLEATVRALPKFFRWWMKTQQYQGFGLFALDSKQQPSRATNGGKNLYKQ